MSRIKFDARHEYEFVHNYKILQNVFAKNRIDKPIPVDRLVRCKMQDNLEFLQWLKKFHDMHYPDDGTYDAEARRGPSANAGRMSSAGARKTPSVVSHAPTPTRGAGPRPSVVRPRPSAVGPRPSAAGPRPSVGGAAAARPAQAPAPAARRESVAPRAPRASMAPRSGSVRSAAISNETINQLTAEMDEMKVSVDSLERERDFYFGKLRDVEVIVQERLADLIRAPAEPGGQEELTDPNGATEAETLKQIQTVLYTTEEGFELPDAAGEEVRDPPIHLDADPQHPEPLDETETF